MQNNKIEFILVDNKKEANDVVSLFFKTVDDLKYEFIPGQYVEVKPPSIKGHGKCYTISSVPGDETICLTIKRKGEVSSALIDMCIGDEITFDGPYGNFYPSENMNDLVMVAGGIGVTPFLSVIRSKLESGKNSRIALIYSNKTKGDIAFFDELNEMAKKYSQFEVIYCLTQENAVNPLISEYFRINKQIFERYTAPVNDKCYYICGSIGFVNDMWKLLKELGVLEEFIFTESFY